VGEKRREGRSCEVESGVGDLIKSLEMHGLRKEAFLLEDFRGFFDHVFEPADVGCRVFWVEREGF